MFINLLIFINFVLISSGKTKFSMASCDNDKGIAQKGKSLQNSFIVSQPGGHGNEVEVEGLWDEWEWPWDPEIALDDFQLVVFGYQLNVERPGHNQGLGDATGDLFDPGQRLRIDIVWWGHKGCIT